MNKLVELRASHGLTIKQVADGTGLNPTTINKLERDQRKAQAITLGKLAKFFEVPLSELDDLADKGISSRAAKGGAATKGITKSRKSDVSTNKTES